MDYYQILKVNQKATQDQIKQAYRRLVKQFHPDSQTDDANHEQIILINAAYEILSDSKSRTNYDRELLGQSRDFLYRRQVKTQAANDYYSQNRQRKKDAEVSESSWMIEVYAPINRYLHLILTPLSLQIDVLSADPFDDRLMSTFSKYIRSCDQNFQQANRLLASQPNPSKYASVAANLYYCLNHISDGIEELHRFTQTYDEYYLYTGKELFNLAKELKQESRYIANQLR